MQNQKYSKYMIAGAVAIILIIATILTCKKPSQNKPDSTVSQPAETETPLPAETSPSETTTPDTDYNVISSDDIIATDDVKQYWDTHPFGAMPESVPPEGIDTSNDTDIDSNTSVVEETDNYADVVWDVAYKFGFTEGVSDIGFWDRYDMNDNMRELDPDEMYDGLFKFQTGTRTRHAIEFSDGYQVDRDVHCTVTGVAEIKDGVATLHALFVNTYPLLDDGLGKYVF